MTGTMSFVQNIEEYTCLHNYVLSENARKDITEKS